jgi:molybdate transport system substrate-binding protein
LTVGFLAVAIVGGNAAEIDLFSANGARLFVNALIPAFERTTNHRVIAKFEEPGVHRRAVLAGESFDLIILPAGWDEIHAKIAGDPISIAHTEFGFLVRTDSAKPDTSSNDAVKRALLAAKSIVYTDPKTGAINGVLFARMLERLGIADEVNKKSKIVSGPPVEFLARGEVDLAVGTFDRRRRFPQCTVRFDATRFPDEGYLLGSSQRRCQRTRCEQRASPVSRRAERCPDNQVKGL